jgi:hypothetical protein
LTDYYFLEKIKWTGGLIISSPVIAAKKAQE